MTARNNILSRLRNAGTGNSASRLGEKPLPAQTLGTDRETLISVFVQRARESGSAVQVVKGRDELTAALTSLREVTALTIPDPQLRAQFPDMAGSDGEARCTLARADAAIAETGSLCLHNRQLPSRALFLCEALVVVLSDKDIVAYQEDYWRSQSSQPPRALHLITGPSRTADVEQTIQIGAHGPKTVTILLTRGIF